MVPVCLCSGPSTVGVFSSATTLTALFLVGVLKSRYTGTRWWRSGGETMLIGAAAAGVAYLLVRTLAHSE